MITYSSTENFTVMQKITNKLDDLLKKIDLFPHFSIWGKADGSYSIHVGFVGNPNFDRHITILDKITLEDVNKFKEMLHGDAANYLGDIIEIYLSGVTEEMVNSTDPDTIYTLNLAEVAMANIDTYRLAVVDEFVDEVDTAISSILYGDWINDHATTEDSRFKSYVDMNIYACVKAELSNDTEETIGAVFNTICNHIKRSASIKEDKKVLYN